MAGPGARWNGHLGVGFHWLQAMERSEAVGTTTWYGIATINMASGMWMRFKY
jgi:hypothetical protein